MIPSCTTSEVGKAAPSGFFIVAWLIGMFFVFLTGPAGAQGAGAVFTVNSTADFGDTNLGDGTCEADPVTEGEQCTLRAAIANANQNPGPDEILFDIPGEGVRNIPLDRDLPSIDDDTGATRIDGYTQPGSSPNTVPRGSNARILVQVEGAGADKFDGLTVESPGNAIRGLALYDFDKALVLMGPDAHNNRVAGNFVGTDATGRFRAPGWSRFSNGVHVTDGARGNTIGGTSAADRNVIAGNACIGVGLYSEGTTSNVVAGNLIGLAPAGDRNLGNWSHGVDINFGASHNVVGGVAGGARNVISGNRNSGVEISHGPNLIGNRVQGNFIGTDTTGEGAPPYASNGLRGVNIEDGALETIVHDNVIGNNRQGGIKIMNVLTRGSRVFGNRIGISRGGRAIRNGLNGVLISNNASESRIGPGNVIANNPVGVQVVDTESVRNAIVGNSVFQNVGLGIDIGLLGKRNINDLRDPDTGANQRQNYPVLDYAASFDGKTVVKGKLNSAPRRTYQLQFFSNPAGTNEGGTFIGARKVTPGKTGDAPFSFYPARMVSPGQTVTATATDPYGNTSEFSSLRTVKRGR